MESFRHQDRLRPTSTYLEGSGKKALAGPWKPVAVLLGVALGAAFYFGPLLQVREVEAIGIQNMNRQEILAKVSLEGKNILAVDTKGVKGLLEGLPWVKEASVGRILPHKVVILVIEREPKVVWKVGGTMYLVDQEGVILGPVSGAKGLPTVYHLDGKPLKPGDKVDADAVNLALRLLDVLPKGMNLQAKNFEYLTQGGLVVETDKGWRARFGDSSDFEAKLSTWKAVLPKAIETCPKGNHTDLRFGMRPFFRCT